ncbi:flagellar hook-basal body complex protein FliE [Oceanobacillus sp. J11TS1]|uniref:flagellar hook-basal body complex protein FliE n=1 Tax=Oceanobacillus sp. J11TS1 TaxID=2807191 RepID=UPI001B1AECEE|nr:flagellar hook-basal body complex protein FliE [Oceanobacillus sp. J11TS1]GIO21963.1 flagellar hook-basal body complex protein FliE [Oceanobacillus sp. J11TS1]
MNTIGTYLPSLHQTEQNKPSHTTPYEVHNNFSSMLKNAIEDLNHTQLESDMKTEGLANGNVENLHDVMISAQKASITLETGVQVQKKVIDAYNEIMRMQV